MDRLYLMREARSILQPYWLISVGVCLVYAIVLGVPPEINTYGEWFSLLLAGPLNLGLCMYFLKISNSESPGIENIINGFQPLLQVLLLYFVSSLLIVLGLLLFILPGIVLSMGFSMSYYIMAEQQDVTFVEALQKSWDLTQDHKMDLFLLNIRFIPWYVLGLLCLVVGVFVVIPWHQTTLALVYKEFKAKKLK
ncbi:MAG: DUF975 family protein [Bacteroidetes bacterium]|nr:DUF975 family protein [Bacteroidota bacterium]MDA1288393.1 DUF975 family protein [Bacteroidota bacterium]